MKPSGRRSKNDIQWNRLLAPLLDDAISRAVFSGAAILVAGSPGKMSGQADTDGESPVILYQGSWGACFAGGPRVTDATWFDLASLTKPLVTATLMIRSVSSGLLDLHQPIQRYLPATLVPADKRDITLFHLLRHSSGLPAYRPFFEELIKVEPGERASTLVRWILAEQPIAPPGKVTEYSDLGFILLGFILNEAYEQPIDETIESIWRKREKPVSMGFVPLDVATDPTLSPGRRDSDNVSFVATEFCRWRKRLICGEVHDENAYCLGGTAGHAGLFGTAHGIWTHLAWLLNLYKGRIAADGWSSQTVQAFWSRPKGPGSSTWTLGFDTPSRTGSSSGNRFSPHTVGHLGFTGTSFWLDLEREIGVILLTNRVYPSRNNQQLKAFRPLIHNKIMEAIHATQ